MREFHAHSHLLLFSAAYPRSRTVSGVSGSCFSAHFQYRKSVWHDRSHFLFSGNPVSSAAVPAAANTLEQNKRKTPDQYDGTIADSRHWLCWILFCPHDTILSKSTRNTLYCCGTGLQGQRNHSQFDATAAAGSCRCIFTGKSRSLMHCFRWKGRRRGHLRSTGYADLLASKRHFNRTNSVRRPLHGHTRKFAIQ